MSERSYDIAAVRRNLRRSACPGLFRIVPARDGGICRVKLVLGQFSAAQAQALARAATRYGNAAIDVTNRANLQLRGIKPDSEIPLIDALLDAGLGPTEIEADDIRNVMVSPTAGIDREQHLDTLPLARDLLSHLERDPAFVALSPKFSFLIDGGESVAATDHHHDIWLAATDSDTMALGFAGTPTSRDGDETAFGLCGIDDAIDIVIAAVKLFLDEAPRDSAITRLRHLPIANFCDRLAAQLGARIAPAKSWCRGAPVSLGYVGIHAQRQDGLCFVGAVPPVARLSPDMMMALADVAQHHGDGMIRLTPWQSVLVPNIPEARAADAMRALDDAGFIGALDRPLATMIACSGMTGCAMGKANTKADARELADHLGAAPRDKTIHLTGCAKSCASPRVAAATLLAVSPGRYDLFVKSPDAESRFGRVVARDLDVSQAAALLTAKATA